MARRAARSPVRAGLLRANCERAAQGCRALPAAQGGPHARSPPPHARPADRLRLALRPARPIRERDRTRPQRPDRVQALPRPRPDQRRDLHVAPNGYAERQLTSPPAGARDDFPDNASDGSFVAFQRCVDLCQIFTVRTRGGVPVALTPPCPPGGSFPECSDDGFPAISPDGREIAFVHASGALDEDGAAEHVGLWTMRADGRHARVLTRPRSRVEEDPEVQWSPDGRRLVFTRVLLATDQHAIFTIRRDGTGCGSSRPIRSTPATARTGRPTAPASCSASTSPRTS